MGVIKNNCPKLCSFTSDSDESLHIAQTSEDDTSVASDIIAPVIQSSSTSRRHLLPTPTHIFSLRKNPGKKRFRRYENVSQLETLLEDQEFCAVTIHDFIPSSCSGFSQVLEDPRSREAWENFVNSSEDEQYHILTRNCYCMRNILSSGYQNPEEAFRKIKAGLRNTLKKSRVPLGTMEHLESKLVEFFANTPADIYISEHLSSFERLLLHAVAQYYCLRSLSFDSKSENVRLVRVTNPFQVFQQPSMTLVKFLIERKNNLQQQTLVKKNGGNLNI